MTFEEFNVEWNKQHPIAKHLAENARSTTEWQNLNSLIIQKLDYLDYCQNNSITVKDEFHDILFEDLKSAFYKGLDYWMIFESFATFFHYLSEEKASHYDIELVYFVNELMRGLEFDDVCRLFLAWTKMRMSFLDNVGLGFPAPEAGYMSAVYSRYRKEFIYMRNTDFSSMLDIGMYFLNAYAHCKSMDRFSMAGDIVKLHDFVLSFMRDLLSSATINGYYDYEDKIKRKIESLKAETAQTPSVFISYTWADKEAVDLIEASIQDFANVHRDKHDVEPGDSLKEFMKSIRKQDFVILVVSDEYLKRRNCMFEVLELLKDYEDNEELFWKKICFYVTASNVYSGSGRAEKIKYWTDICEDYERTLTGIPEPASEGLVREAKILRYISMEIDKLLDRLNEELCDTNIDEFIKHTIDRLNKWAQYGSDPYEDCLLAFLSSLENEQAEND